MTDRRFTVTLAAAVAALIVTAAPSPALAMYNPNVGRFLQRDPVGTATGPSATTGFVAHDAMPQASREYPDGMNAYAGHHVMHLGVDPSGLEWEVSRDGERRATATCECGDTVAELAEAVGLEPAEFGDWLQAMDGQGLPEDVDEEIQEDRTFSVPNTVYAVRGDYGHWNPWKDAKKGFGLALKMTTGHRLRQYRNDMKKRGYFVETDYQASLAKIDGYLGDADIHGFFFVGHGSGGVLFTHGDDFALFPGQFVMNQHHRLGFVTLMACEAGEKDSWRDTVSTHGVLRMYEHKIRPATWSWDDIPKVEDQ